MCVFLAGAFIVTKGNGQAVLSVRVIGRAFKGFCFGGKVDCIYIKLIRPSRLRLRVSVLGGLSPKHNLYMCVFLAGAFIVTKGNGQAVLSVRVIGRTFKGFCFGGKVDCIYIKLIRPSRQSFIYIN